MASRRQYTRDQLKAIEAVVLENPKRYLTRPAPRAEEPRRSRFERPAGYQPTGRGGRDRDAETFEEGFQYELDQRIKGADYAAPVPHTVPNAAMRAAAPQAPPPQPLAQQQPPAPQQVKQKESPAPPPRQGPEDDEFSAPIVPQARKSRFNFAESGAVQPSATPPQQLQQPAGVQPAVAQYGQPSVAPQQPMPQHPIAAHLNYPQPQTAHHAMPSVPAGYGAAYAGYLPVVMPHQHAMPMHTMPHLQGASMAQPSQAGMFTVQAGGAPQQQMNPGSFTVTQQQPAPTTQQAPAGRSNTGAELNVASALANARPSRANHSHQQHQQHQQQYSMPPDPAIVSYSQSKTTNAASSAPPPALQALFSNLGAHNTNAQQGTQSGAIDAAALEASLHQQASGTGQQQGNSHRGDYRGGHRGGRRR
jgi:hypothetical protein